MRTAYLDYAMSVIVARAIPDLRDGLKPVHRRILYAMQHDTATPTTSPIEIGTRRRRRDGEVPPAWRQAIYDALVRMAQDFSMSLPLLDGQGNFGSMDGDNPAAMRYTEVRMARNSHALAGGYRQGHGRFPGQLRRQGQRGADGPAGPFPQPAGQRRRRHRGGHGHQHPAAQSGRGDRRLLALIDDPDLTSID
jgi:DNA gyrase subunit A